MTPQAVRRAFLATGVVLVVAAVIGGILLLDSPGKARAKRFDARRVEDLQSIETDVEGFHEDEGRLPESLEELIRQPGPPSTIRDPQTGAVYGYRVIDPNTYELCASFQLSSESEPGWRPPGSTWKHGPGPTCFRRTVQDKEKPAPATP